MSARLGIAGALVAVALGTGLAGCGAHGGRWSQARV